jgi:hypothetical protein
MKVKSVLKHIFPARIFQDDRQKIVLSSLDEISSCPSLEKRLVKKFDCTNG